jgi:hypothetical protein
VGSVKQSNRQEQTYIPRSQDLGFLMGRQSEWSYVLLGKKGRQLMSDLLYKLWYHCLVTAKIRDWLSVSKRGMQHYDMDRYLMLAVWLDYLFSRELRVLEMLWMCTGFAWTRVNTSVELLPTR